VNPPPGEPACTAAGARLGSQLLAVLRPWRGRLAVVVAAIVGASLMELAPPLIVRHVIDNNLTVGRTDGLVMAAALYLVAVAGTQLFTFTYGYQAAVVAQNALHALRVRVFERLCRLPVSYHDRNPLGDTVNRCTADLDAVGLLFTEGIATMVGQLVPLVFVFGAMVVLSPALTVVAAVSLPPLVVMTRFMRRKVRDAQRANRAALGRVAAQLEESLAGSEVIRAFAREATFGERFRGVVGETLTAFCRSNLFNTFYAPLLGILAAVFTALLLELGARRSLGTPAVPLGTLTAFVLLYQRFFAPITALGEQWQRVQGALSGAERVFQVLALPAEEPVRRASASAPAAVARRARGIEVRNLSFGYVEASPVLSDVSFDVRPGEHVALVGRTGAGKSTMVHLLGGLYAPWSGSVRVSGADPRSLSDQERGAVLAVVPQHAQLLSATARHNITLGAAPYGTDAVEQALRGAGLGDLFEQLPAGVETLVAGVGGGSGTQLSAGQRQLLAVARGMLSKPAVLILDEATAGVDEATDAFVRSTLHHAVRTRGVALLTVVHRLETARSADRVIVMERGRIVEEGPPAELATGGGRFAGFLALEAAGWSWESAVPLAAADGL
jgi:ATP-binding cassette subfamily B multidrug efflux pump